VALEATVTNRKSHRKGKRSNAKSILRLPDLQVAKAAVMNSLSCPDTQPGYRHAIDEFVDWYCSEPRLSISKTVVVRYRMHLESRHLAPGTINLRLGAVRRLAYEAADGGLLSADLAAGIRRVKGVKKLGVRLGNWLTPEQGKALWQAPDPRRLRGKRDRALLAILLACGLRRHEIAELRWITCSNAKGIGEGRSHSDCPGPRLGPRPVERLDRSGWTSSRKAFPKGEQRRQALGRRSNREAGVARR